MCNIKISTKLLTLNWNQGRNYRYVGQFIKDENKVLYKIGKERIEKVMFNEYYITKIKLPKNIGVKYSERYKCIYPETIELEIWLKDQKITNKQNKELKENYNNSLYPYS